MLTFLIERKDDQKTYPTGPPAVFHETQRVFSKENYVSDHPSKSIHGRFSPLLILAVRLHQVRGCVRHLGHTLRGIGDSSE